MKQKPTASVVQRQLDRRRSSPNPGANWPPDDAANFCEPEFQRTREKGIEDMIVATSPRTSPRIRESTEDTEACIKKAIASRTHFDAKAITIVVAGDKVTFTGTVGSWAERRQADLAAWSSPHVSEVYNHIVVKP